MKKAPPSKGNIIVKSKFHLSYFLLFSYLVNKPAWDQLIGLYPYLVDCTTTTSPEVSRSLREALLQYTDLLQPPKCLNTEIANIAKLQNATQSNGQE